MKTLFRPKHDETVYVRSMGKTFALLAVATTDEAANDYCAKHDRAGVIACFGDLVFIANLYAAEKTRD